MSISFKVLQHSILSCDPVARFLEAREVSLIGKE